MLMRLLATLQITRIHNMLAAALSFAVGYHVAGGEDSTLLGVSTLLVALITGAGNVINDWFDEPIDRINKPRRPIPSGRLSRSQALILYVSLTVVVIAVALMNGDVRLLLVAGVWQLALFFYASRCKRVLVAGNLLVASVTSSAFLAGGYLCDNAAAALVPTGIAFLFVLAREIVKGGEDVSGDLVAGVQTIAVKWGTAAAARIAATLMLLLATCLPLPTVLGYYGRGYFFVMELLVLPGLAYSAWVVVRRGDHASFARSSQVLKVTMFFGILAVALGQT